MGVTCAGCMGSSPPSLDSPGPWPFALLWDTQCEMVTLLAFQVQIPTGPPPRWPLNCPLLYARQWSTVPPETPDSTMPLPDQLLVSEGLPVFPYATVLVTTMFS